MAMWLTIAASVIILGSAVIVPVGSVLAPAASTGGVGASSPAPVATTAAGPTAALPSPPATTATSSPATTPEPQGWEKVSEPSWQQGGVPVLFFYGAAWCPYCASSSWPVYAALAAFGNFSGNAALGYSGSREVYPNTPEVLLGNWRYSSSWIALQAVDPNVTVGTFPSTTNSEQAFYVATYSGGSIPFVVLNGQYVHGGSTLIPPSSMSVWAGTGAQTVLNQVNTESGNAWTRIENQTFVIEALMLLANGGHGPAAVVSNPNVQAWVLRISSSTYEVTFTESGLPSGASWSVTLNGTTSSSTSPEIAFTEQNGIYAYTVGSVTGYTTTPPSGSVSVAGAAVTQVVTFAALPPGQYSVTFAEMGLPTGTRWTVMLNGSAESSAGSTVVFTEPNGNYNYTVESSAGYARSPSSGTVTVSGASPPPVSVSFTSTSVSSSSGLSSWVWIVIGVVIAAIVVGVVIAVLLRRRPPSVGPSTAPPPTPPAVG